MRRLVQQLIAALGLLAIPPLPLHAAPLVDLGPGGDAATITTSPETHLPTWVQTAVAAAALYVADTASDQTLATLQQHTFLRVLDGGASRLHAQAYDGSGNPTRTGWIDADQVLPSAPGTDWLVAAKATTVWSAAGFAVRQIDRYTPLQLLDGPVLNRVLVSVYRPDFTGVVGEGWVDVSDTGPALPPQARVPAPADTAAEQRAASITSQQAFLAAAGQAARQATAITHVPASVTIAQAILESDWGRSALSRDANNYFGMKVMGTLGNDGLVYLPTSEYDASGAVYQTTSAFRAYKSMADSVADHDELLATASRYAPAMQAAADPRQFAALVAEGGYSSDPDYADKVVDLMDRYNLYQYDR